MKTAIVTGAAGGMGLAAAGRLAEEGYTVFGLDLREPEGEIPFRFVRTDLTDPASVERAFRTVSETAETADCIIHMAGVYDMNSLVEMDERDWERIFAVNLSAVWRVNRVFLPLLKEGSRIVITSSELAPLDPLPFTGIYGITKAALEKYAFSLRMELQLLGVKVVVLRPGAVDTGLLNVSTDRMERFCASTPHYRFSAEKLREIVGRVEARKIPPEKIADLLVRVLRARRPKYVYAVNRNPLLLLLNALPDGLQYRIIGGILRPRE
jgi:NAD(P)-dependent dehydrogenase (short-subunit alcohol dehydrogenase family)